MNSTKLGLTIVITALIAGGGAYWYAKNMTTPNDGSSGKIQSNNGLTYKFYDDDNSGTKFEIPSTWSVFVSPDSGGDDELGELPFLAVAPDHVTVSDSNIQVSFYGATDKIAGKLVAEAKGDDDSLWSKETVAGVVADVYFDPEGVFERGFYKEYYLTVDRKNPTEFQTIVIKLSGSTDNGDDITSAFKHIIETIEFYELSL